LSTDGVGGVKKFQQVLWIFELCLWCDQFEFVALFMVFNLWVGTGFIFKSCIQFLIFQQPFSCYNP